jgi:hypothetical protein
VSDTSSASWNGYKPRTSALPMPNSNGCGPSNPPMNWAYPFDRLLRPLA